jgi:hypothetical protein
MHRMTCVTGLTRAEVLSNVERDLGAIMAFRILKHLDTHQAARPALHHQLITRDLHKLPITSDVCCGPTSSQPTGLQ